MNAPKGMIAVAHPSHGLNKSFAITIAKSPSLSTITIFEF